MSEKPIKAVSADSDPPATLVPAVAAVTLVQAVVTMGAVVPATVAPELAQSLGVPTVLIGLQVSLTYSGAVAISFQRTGFLGGFASPAKPSAGHKRAVMPIMIADRVIFIRNLL